jgi:hypothetical protein
MDGAAARLSEKSSSATVDSEKTIKLNERLERLLREAAEVEVELSRADGTIKGIPHYSVIEGRAHALGKQLTRQVHERQINELVASQPPTCKCSGCGTRCELRSGKRDLTARA